MVSVFDVAIVPGWTDPDVSSPTPGVVWAHENSVAHPDGFVVLANIVDRRATQGVPAGYWDRPIDADDTEAYIVRLRLRVGNIELRMGPLVDSRQPGGGAIGPQFRESAEDVLGLIIRLSDGTELSWLLSDLDNLDEDEPYDWNIQDHANPITAAQAATIAAAGSVHIVLVDTSHANVDFANRQVASAMPPPAATVLSGQTLTGTGTLAAANLLAAPAATIITDTAVTSAPEAASDTYGLGETIIVSVTWAGPVDVTGSPRFPLNFGQSPSGGPEYADYARGDGTAVLEFEWVVAATDLDTNGVFFYGPTDPQDRGLLVGGTIRNAGTQIDADRATLNRGTQAAHKVDGSLTPGPSSVVLSGQTLTGSGTLGRASLAVAAAGATVLSGQTLTGSGTLGRASLTVAAAGATVLSGQTLTGSGALGRASLTGGAATVPRANIDPQDLARPVMALAGDRWLGGPESATQRLRDALIITRGSYPAARDYGGTLADVLDRPLQTAGQAALMAAVADAVAHAPNGLDDVRLRSVAVRTLDGVTTLDIRADWVSESGAITPIGLREQLAAR